MLVIVCNTPLTLGQVVKKMKSDELICKSFENYTIRYPTIKELVLTRYTHLRKPKLTTRENLKNNICGVNIDTEGGYQFTLKENSVIVEFYTAPWISIFKIEELFNGVLYGEIKV